MNHDSAKLVQLEKGDLVAICATILFDRLRGSHATGLKSDEEIAELAVKRANAIIYAAYGHTGGR